VSSDPSDDLSRILASILLPGIEERTVTPAMVEARGGISTHETRALFAAFGLPAPVDDEPALTPAEADAFVTLGRFDADWPPDLRLRVARVYGRLLARIAQAELSLFRQHFERRLGDDRGSTYSTLDAAREAFAGLVPVTDPLLSGVHRRWLEHELAQAAVSGAEAEVEQQRLPGAEDVTFLFCDLKDFTAFADREGDAAAVAAIDRFNEVVMAERGAGVRFMKLLGDGVMVVYSDTPDAVGAGAAIIAAMRAGGPPGVHATAHRGVAIPREGDWFGGAVNLAARLLDSAECDELVATRAAVDAAGDGFSWQSAGERRVRGFVAAVEVFRLVVPGVSDGLGPVSQ
jgi:class 3 adenylate cyclase